TSKDRSSVCVDELHPPFVSQLVRTSISSPYRSVAKINIMCIFTPADFYRSAAYGSIGFALFAGAQSQAVGYSEAVTGNTNCATAHTILSGMAVPALILGYMCYHVSVSLDAVLKMSYGDMITSQSAYFTKMNAKAAIVKSYPRIIKILFVTMTLMTFLFVVIGFQNCGNAGECYNSATGEGSETAPMPTWLVALDGCAIPGSGNMFYMDMFIAASFCFWLMMSGRRSRQEQV
ncbi:unnamed protein product, partial [Amoebophrya sp. A120]